MSNRLSDYMTVHRELLEERKKNHPSQRIISTCELAKDALWERMTNEEKKTVWQLEEGPA